MGHELVVQLQPGWLSAMELELVVLVQPGYMPEMVNVTVVMAQPYRCSLGSCRGW